MKPAIIAAAALLALGAPSAHAVEPLIAKLVEADDAVKGVAPEFVCYDQTRPETCQQLRAAFASGGWFVTADYADGRHSRCFSPGDDPDISYRVCDNSAGKIWPAIFNGSHWVEAPSSDPRCHHWGGP